MSLEITLRVEGAQNSANGSSDPAERLVHFLQELEGVLSVHYDSESRRFALRYDQSRTTILRVLAHIEVAGQQAGRVYRPTDVQPSQGDSFPPANSRSS